MRLLIQRVRKASVYINNKQNSVIEKGLLILIGVENEDAQEDIEFLIKKVANLRIFDDEDGVMNKSIIDTNGDIMVVSQFTLHASTKKGNRPSYIRAAKPAVSIPLYEKFCKSLSELVGKEVKTVKQQRSGHHLD